MKKRVLLSLVTITILLGVGGVTAAFAEGQGEEPAQPYGRPGPRQGRGWEQPPAPTFSEETITVTGPLYFDNRIHPELKSEGKEYELLVPRHYLFEARLKDGQTVTVEGYTVTGMPTFKGDEGEEIHLWVTKAIIDGKEYDLERHGAGPGRGRTGMRRPPRGWDRCGPGDEYGPGWGRRPWGRGDKDDGRRS